MKLNVLFFAHVRERAGIASRELVLPEGATVADAWSQLCAEHPRIEPLRPSIRFAVDGEFVPPETVIEDGQELVMIPPVSGGSGVERVRLTHLPLDGDVVRQLEGAVERSSSGASLTFRGVVRDHARGRHVTSLEYEAYEPMALRVLQGILDEVKESHPEVEAVVWHRLGHLEVGEVAVVVAAGSPHRAEAFEACQMILRRLKEDVPIWKRETGPDGAEWVSERP